MCSFYAVDAEERVLHDTAPNSDQEEDAEAQVSVEPKGL